ncbi:MAG: tetratricopeptide repeat protein [Hyphomicrobiales bacterium]
MRLIIWLLSLTMGVLLNLTATSAQPMEARGYVTAAVCAGCHTEEAKAWNDSHHGWALRRALAENVLGDFNDASFTHKGVTTRFITRDGKAIVDTLNGKGEREEFEVKFTVGVEPLQQYLLATGDGKLQVLDIAWDTVNKRWYHVFPNQENAPGNGLHWTGSYKNWQGRCAVCHQTGFVKAYDPLKRSYATRWADDTVACEACHGPGTEHVKWAQNPQSYAPQTQSGRDKFGFSVSFAQDRQQMEKNVCGPCHSRREAFDPDSPPEGSTFENHYNLSLLRNGLYHADGQVNDEVYVLGSFLQSKMHEKGVTCTNCHNPHTLELKAEGNGVCTQCHSEAGNNAFPSLTKKAYDAPSHHFHEQGSDAAQCVSCHMPEKNFMVVDGRRDHSFRVPRPDLSITTGVPNACTTCHEGQSAQWADEAINNWYPNTRSGKPHFAVPIAAARTGDNSAETQEALIKIAEDETAPAIVRASALELANIAAVPQLVGRAVALLKSDSAVIRAAASRHFRQAPPQMRAQVLFPLLSDKRKMVRIAAARELAGIPRNAVDPTVSAKLTAANREFQSSLMSRADFPETQMSIAGLAMSLRNMRVAKSALSEAVALDPQLSDAWRLKARIEMAERNPQAARATLEAAIAVLPDAPDLHASLARTLAQSGADTEAITVYEKAIGLMPHNADLHLEFAGTLTRLKRHTQALQQAELARQKGPDNPTVLALIALNQLQLGDLKKARDTVRELSLRFPAFQLPRELQALKTLP